MWESWPWRLRFFFVFNPAKSGAAKDNTAAAQSKEGGHGGGKEGGHGGKEGGKEGGKGGSPLTFALEPFILNLADIESNRYLKISVTLEFDAPRTTQDAEQRVPQIRDGMILLMSEPDLRGHPLRRGENSPSRAKSRTGSARSSSRGP